MLYPILLKRIVSINLNGYRNSWKENTCVEASASVLWLYTQKLCHFFPPPWDVVEMLSSSAFCNSLRLLLAKLLEIF